MEVSFAKDRKQKNPLLEKGKELINKLKNYKFPNTFYYFLILIAISIGFYMVMLVENDFSLAYGGDYSAQYIPMGYHIWDYYHDWIHTGHFTLFDQELYLGANSIGSNAYYGLFSPFNIIIVILPRSFVPQSVAITSFIKLACAGLFFSLYMKDAFKVKEKVSFICGIAYAFAGWGAFYLWFNNYQDILVFFPLVLWGVEKTLQQGRPFLLAIGTFFIVICNYVLMVPYLMCAFFYAMFRYFQRLRLNTATTNLVLLGFGFLGFFAGLLMGMFIFVPALMNTLLSPKLDSYSYFGELKGYLSSRNYSEFFKLLFSWKKAPDQHGRLYADRHAFPIIEFFFPPTTCRSLPTLKRTNWDFDDIAVSLWCYTPFIMFLVPALIQSGKDKKWSHFIAFGLFLISLFTPFMYFLTMALTNSYARWTLVVATSLIAYVGIYIDRIPNVARWHIHVGYLFALAGMIAAWVLTYKLIIPDTEGKTVLEFRFVDEDMNYTNIAFIIEILYTTAVYLTLFFLYNKKAFTIVTTAFVTIEAIAVGNFVTLGHGYDSRHNNGYATNERFKKIIDQIQKDDPQFYRFYSCMADDYSSMNAFVNGYATCGFFHSLYNFEVNDFTLWTGMRSGEKSVGGDYRGKYQDLDNLLGVKYYIISKNKSKYYDIEKYNPGGFVGNVPFDFEERKDLETNEFITYENTYLNDFGLVYDTLYSGEIVKESRGGVTCVKNAVLLSKAAAIGVDDGEEIAKQYSNLTLLDKPEDAPLTTSIKNNYHSINYRHTMYNLHSLAKGYPFENIVNIPNEFEPEENFNKDETMNYYAFYTSMKENEPLYKEGTSLYIRASFSGSIKYNFYFIDKDNKIFMFDAHDDDTTDNTAMMRGFYLKKDVYKIAVCGKYYQSYVEDSSIRIYSEAKEEYDARRNSLLAHPITNITYAPDKFTFETNYDQNHFVVSRVAFDKGWTLEATNKETGKTTNIKLYNGNGGFVSFVAPIGHYTYKMTYQTPYLTGSYIGSLFSFMAFVTAVFAYQLSEDKKKTHHLDKLFREN